MNIKFSNKECVFEEYELNDITEYKRAANKLKKNENIKFVIAIIPTINESDIENPYNPFKRVCAEINLPSQMISLKTAKNRKMETTNKKQILLPKSNSRLQQKSVGLAVIPATL